MAPGRPRTKNKFELSEGEWYDLEVKQIGNSKVQVETAKKKTENISEWNYLPPMGHCSDIVRYKNEEGDMVVAILTLGGQDWKDPVRAGQVSADLFIKQLLITADEVAGIGPFRQIKAIKAVSSKQSGTMADGYGSMIRPLKNASLNVIKSDTEGGFEAILAFGEFLEAGGLSNLTSNYIYKIVGNAESSLVEEVTLYISEKPADNPMYGGPLPDSPVLAGHKATGRRGQAGTVLGDGLVLYSGGVQHTSQLLRKSRLVDPFLLLKSETMEMVKLNFNGDFHRAHHCTEFVKDLKKVVVSGGMKVPEVTGAKVSDWFSINEFLIFKLDEDMKEIILIETVLVEFEVEFPLEMQGVASAVFGTEIIFAGGFIKPPDTPKFGKAPRISSALITVDFKTMKYQLLDDSEDGQTAQATLKVLDSKSVALIGGSMEALKIFTSKLMSEDKPCVFASKCKVFQKIIKSEIEKLEISCENHADTFSHVLCDPDLKNSIPNIKKKLKSGQPIVYNSCPVCKGLVLKKKKK